MPIRRVKRNFAGIQIPPMDEDLLTSLKCECGELIDLTQMVGFDAITCSKCGTKRWVIERDGHWVITPHTKSEDQVLI